MTELGWEPDFWLLVGCSLTSCLLILPSGAYSTPHSTACRMQFQVARLPAGSAPGHVVQSTGNTQAGHCCPHDPARLPVGSSSVPFGGVWQRDANTSLLLFHGQSRKSRRMCKCRTQASQMPDLQTQPFKKHKRGVRGDWHLQPSAEVAKSTLNCAVEFLSQCQTIPGGFI